MIRLSWLNLNGKKKKKKGAVTDLLDTPTENVYVSFCHIVTVSLCVSQLAEMSYAVRENEYVCC